MAFQKVWLGGYLFFEYCEDLQVRLDRLQLYFVAGEITDWSLRTIQPTISIRLNNIHTI